MVSNNGNPNEKELTGMDFNQNQIKCIQQTQMFIKEIESTFNEADSEASEVTMKASKHDLKAIKDLLDIAIAGQLRNAHLQFEIEDIYANIQEQED